MSFSVRDGKFDVVVVQGSRVETWPSAGVRALSALCAEMGLTVGVLGGDTLTARGVIPLPGTGGLVLAEDIQHRIHRIQARAIVKVSAPSQLPDPFPGWHSPGLIPLSTAVRLKSQGHFSWDPGVVILGTGNRALRFGASLLTRRTDTPEFGVYCVETNAQWGAKRFAGWEVDRRRFERLGGRIVEARPHSLTPKSPLVWEFRLEDSQGIRVLEVARVVSAGPFAESPGIWEYPPGSSLYELENTALETRGEDVEGWDLEEERGRWLAAKIVKSLMTDLGPGREEFEKITRRARARLKRSFLHRAEPFAPAYQGKWIAPGDMRFIQAFSGTPKAAHKTRLVASIECFEGISCNLCEQACPTSAIRFGKDREQILDESACITCGKCLPACPSGATLLIQEQEDRSTAVLTFPWREPQRWAVGEFASLVNRRGDTLGTGRVSALSQTEEAPEVQLVQVDVPTHLAWDARGIRKPRANSAVDEAYLASEAFQNQVADQKVEITLNGDRRLVRDKLPVSLALYEIGQSRAEDTLMCPDGSCGLCRVSVDGVPKLACQAPIHRGMAIRVPASEPSSALCPCMNVVREQIVERIRQGNLQSPEAVISVTHVGEGKCHGQLCMDAFRRVLQEEGIDATKWIDWRFPMAEWVLTPRPHD